MLCLIRITKLELFFLLLSSSVSFFLAKSYQTICELKCLGSVGSVCSIDLIVIDCSRFDCDRIDVEIIDFKKIECKISLYLIMIF